ncbi:MAG TPA: type VI secretion system membrane subunit TssM [Ignavibacteriaceae bacterium]
MSAIINFIKNPSSIMAIAGLLLVILVLVLGPIFGMSFIVEIAIIVFIFLVVTILILYKKMKDAQKANQIEASIGSQADSQMQNISPEKKAEIEQFKKQLEAAIASLKNSKIANGKSGKAALYALPWYMIIGPSAAGKTTAIQNSGLEFPFGKDGFRGVGGTRNCDWFFSTKAIFLDTAGRYVSQTEDRPEWVAFLETLKKNRKRKPVNGVMLAINIDEVINAEKDQLSEHAKNMRQRIDELIENLGVNFPVYFVFTKCDLIQGFVEYFGDFSEIERSQIWGTTFNSQQILAKDPKGIFEAAFKKLAAKLFEIRTIRLSSPLKREQRKKVFLFPFQFNSLKQKLTFLIGEVFQHNPYQDNPLFRGFYFTSGTQEGIPLDIAIREIARQFNLPEPSADESEDTVEKKNYFIKDLLNDIVIGDQNFSTGQTRGAVQKQGSARMISLVVSALVLALVAAFTFIGHSGNSSFLQKEENVASTFVKIDWSGNLLKSFAKTDSLITLIKNTQDGKGNEAFISFGMDRSEKTLPYLKEIFIKKTSDFFQQNIYDEIVKSLNDYANGKDFSGEITYNYLKSYLLLGSERARVDTSEQKFLTNVCSEILNVRYIYSNPMASTGEKDSLKHLFRNYLSFYISLLKDKEVPTFTNDNLLISLVRDRIQYRPNAESIYARLKQNGISQFPNELSLEQTIGGRYSSVMATEQRVPYIFTADGWKNYIQQAIIEESVNPGKEDWVLGRSSLKPASDSFNSEEIKKGLVNLYLNDYKLNWLQFLQSIRYTGFDNTPLASNNLKILGDPVSSPLIAVLKLFATQLSIIVEIQSPQDSTAKKSQFSGLDLNSANLDETKKYVKFVLGSDGSTGADLNAILVQYGTVGGIVDQVKSGQDLAKDYAVKVLSQRAAELPTALQVIRGASFNTPALQNLLSDPITLAWKAILADAGQFLNQQWKAKVSDAFNRALASSFPFKESPNDAPIQDFKDFFKPQSGVLWSFYNDELGDFINKDRWKINQWENQGLAVSDGFITALKKADDITSTLFKNGDLGINYRLKPQLPESKTIGSAKPLVEQVYLYLDGTEDYYKMGSPFWSDFTWPGTKGTPGAKMNISLRNLGTSETKSYDGEWALFRLLNQATISRGESSSQYNFNWFFQKTGSYNVTVSYQLNTGSSKNPFARDFFNTFRLPDKLN